MLKRSKAIENSLFIAYCTNFIEHTYCKLKACCNMAFMQGSNPSYGILKSTLYMEYSFIFISHLNKYQ